MKTLFTLSLILFTLHIQSQDIASFKIPEQYAEVKKQPTYFHKTMNKVNEPDFKRAGSLLNSGGSLIITGAALGALGAAFSYLTREENPEISRNLAIGSGAAFVLCIAIGGINIAKAGSVLKDY